MSSAAVTKAVAEVISQPSDTRAHVTQAVAEVIYPVIARSPTVPTGAGVTQCVAEVISLATLSVHVTQVVVETIVLDTSTIGETGVGPNLVVSFGYAV